MYDGEEVYPSLQLNYNRGIGLLYLATEQVSQPHSVSFFTQPGRNLTHKLRLTDTYAQQVRQFDPNVADIINKEHLRPLQSWFDRAMRNPNCEDVFRNDSGGGAQWQNLQGAATGKWQQDNAPNMPPTPPGLGYGSELGFEEAKPKTAPSFRPRKFASSECAPLPF